jgi:hypothetical protein
MLENADQEIIPTLREVIFKLEEVIFMFVISYLKSHW